MKNYSNENELREEYKIEINNYHYKINNKKVKVPKKLKNYISTSKYTWYNFAPKILYEQFSKMSNIYFVIIAVLQCFPDISNADGKPIILFPLCIVVIVNSIKDFYEDWKRKKSDEYRINMYNCKNNHKIENIISKNISLLTKKPIKINNKKSRSPSLKIQRPKSANKTINFINNIKPLSFITNKNQNIELKDIMKLKLKYSPSPSTNIRNNIKNINLRKENLINKKRNVIN